MSHSSTTVKEIVIKAQFAPDTATVHQLYHFVNLQLDKMTNELFTKHKHGTVKMLKLNM